MDLTERLAREILQIRARGQACPPQKASTLIDVATMLRAHGIGWPVSLSMAIDALHRDLEAQRERAAPPRRLVGHLDHAGHDCVRGWAIDPDTPEEPVELEVLIDGRPVATARADLLRSDVADAGHGNGRQGFRFEFEPRLPSARGHAITVRRRADRAVLGACDVRACA